MKKYQYINNKCSLEKKNIIYILKQLSYQYPSNITEQQGVIRHILRLLKKFN